MLSSILQHELLRLAVLSQFNSNRCVPFAACVYPFVVKISQTVAAARWFARPNRSSSPLKRGTWLGW
jgi:hypothetical protein